MHQGGEWRDAPPHEGADLGPGARIRGPAVVEEPYAVIVAPARWTLACADGGEPVAKLADEAEVAA